MKIIIFGATGTIGKHLVKQSLEQGHDVYAFSRNMPNLDVFNYPDLHKIEGDVYNSIALQQAIKGKDVVVITLGSGKNLKSLVRSKGTENIINAMKITGVKRLICQTTLGAGDSVGNLNFFWKYIMFGWILKYVYQDHQLQEEWVKNSGLDWTIVRPAAFTEGEKTEQYRYGFSTGDRSTRLKISRADVADFMVKQIGSSDYLLKSPGVSY